MGIGVCAHDHAARGPLVALPRLHEFRPYRAGVLMRVAADREVCMAAGMCVMTADAFFDQDEDGIVRLAFDEVPDGPDADLRRRVHNAVKLCPSGALQLVSE